jgi:hypothetical protein
MAAGKLTAEAVETVKALYPAIYDKIRSELIKSMALRRTRVGYAARVQLSTMFDAPFDHSMRPEMIRALQTNIAAGEEGQQADPQTGKVTPQAIRKPEATTAQRLAER